MQAIIRKAHEVSTRAETQMRHLLSESSSEGTTDDRPTVLLVEDDQATQLAIESWLRLKGFSVEAAASGSEAAGHLDDPGEAIDVAVVDIGLPDVDGVSLCEVIHQFHPSLPLVICSGTATPEDVRRVREVGVKEVFEKPVDPDELASAIQSALP